MSHVTVGNAGLFVLKVHSHLKVKMKYYVIICVCAATGLFEYILQEDLTPRAFLNCLDILKSCFGPLHKVTLDISTAFVPVEKAINAAWNSFKDTAKVVQDALGIVATAA